MGLDQYAGSREWRKHARLQQFMAVKYAEQNPKDKDNDMNLGFNGGPVKLTKEIVDQLVAEAQGVRANKNKVDTNSINKSAKQID